MQKLGIVNVIQPQELQPECFAKKVLTCLQQTPAPMTFDVPGVEKTARWVREVVEWREIAA